MIAHLAQDLVIGAGCTIAVLTVVVCFASCGALPERLRAAG